MSQNNYIMFKKPRYCPNATSIGYARPWVSIGSLIRYGDPAGPEYDREYGRVICLVRRDGCGKTYRNAKGSPTPHLMVLQLGDNWSFGYERHVPLELVQEVLNPDSFIRWFIFGEVPSPEVCVAVRKYGAMSDHYLSRYLTAEEGAIRDDWKDVARHGRKP